MSVASEIQRLQTAKADIKTAIENKGVTVPSSAKLDTYDDYIDSISGGGGTYQQKTVSPATSQQVITPDTGYDALSQVTVNAATLQVKQVQKAEDYQAIRADDGYYGLQMVVVPPYTDSGANGLYKKIVQGTALSGVVEDTGITRIDTSGGRVLPFYLDGATKVSFPNCGTVGTNSIFHASSTLRVLELKSTLKITNNSSSSTGQGFIKFASNPPKLKIVGIATLGQYAGITFRSIPHIWFTDVTTVTNNCIYSTAGSTVVTVTFDKLASLNGQSFYGTSPKSTFEALIIRTATLCTLSSAFTNSDISAGFTKIYVPQSLASAYKGATNWTTRASQIYGIDEDTSITTEDTFTPSYTGSDVTTWDIVNLQDDTVATIDSSTGEVTPSDNGRILVRGLDANDEIKYVVYLVIGNGGF